MSLNAVSVLLHASKINTHSSPFLDNIADKDRVRIKDPQIFYTPVERRDVLWNRPVRPSVRLSVRPSTIACDRDILKTACRIDFTFWYGLNTTKTSDAIDLGHSTKSKMAATVV